MSFETNPNTGPLDVDHNQHIKESSEGSLGALAKGDNLENLQKGLEKYNTALDKAVQNSPLGTKTWNLLPNGKYYELTESMRSNAAGKFSRAVESETEEQLIEVQEANTEVVNARRTYQSFEDGTNPNYWRAQIDVAVRKHNDSVQKTVAILDDFSQKLTKNGEELFNHKTKWRVLAGIDDIDAEEFDDPEQDMQTASTNSVETESLTKGSVAKEKKRLSRNERIAQQAEI